MPRLSCFCATNKPIQKGYSFAVSVLRRASVLLTARRTIINFLMSAPKIRLSSSKRSTSTLHNRKTLTTSRTFISLPPLTGSTRRYRFRSLFLITKSVVLSILYDDFHVCQRPPATFLKRKRKRRRDCGRRYFYKVDIELKRDLFNASLDALNTCPSRNSATAPDARSCIRGVFRLYDV